jgi:hypothetical protein
VTPEPSDKHAQNAQAHCEPQLVVSHWAQAVYFEPAVGYCVTHWSKQVWVVQAWAHPMNALAFESP